MTSKKIILGFLAVFAFADAIADQPAHDLNDSYYYGNYHYCHKYGTSPTSVSDSQSTFANGLDTAEHCQSFMHANAFSYYGYYDGAGTFYTANLEVSGTSVWISWVDEYSNTGSILLSGFNSMDRASNSSGMSLFSYSYGIVALDYYEYQSGNEWVMGFSGEAFYTRCYGSISKSNCTKVFY